MQAAQNNISPKVPLASLHPTLRHRLRAETRASHDQLDLLMGEGKWNCLAFRRRFFLTHAIGFATFGTLFRAAGAEWYDHWSTLALDYLGRDLDDLGLGPLNALVHPLPPSRALDPDGLAPDGLAYVMIGSRLGAALLRQHIKAQDAAPSHYLHLFPDGDMWSDLARRLSMAPAYGMAADRIVTSAETGFALFINAHHTAVNVLPH
ncbi:hypothetical protein PB2503_10144 [Parvularcula bermudensis HTCC2503]|uniref:Heme oxygenase n=1 Tax=Parvularcula bermudensis (strain ATCC BAA-594 / HTCC2503 / KCTC 12087) TaxID=314260 RepID=E0TEY7_PARBH|nr:biliverdin-producing heme oxygenase [Parvularcula bermudensis]ADM10080.1 hypothetical protein PB2503_10144 [Parvularcula bermudensis HTCC2503]